MSVAAIEWRLVPFDELSPRELHDVLRLRQDVFIVEQNCAFPEIDGRDANALHLLGSLEGRLVAYARVFAPGVHTAQASIGRVVTHPSVRGSGIGRPLMRQALRVVDRIAPGSDVRIAAQAHLERFYASLGFRRIGGEYLEDGITHVDMVRAAGSDEATAAPED